MLHTHRLLLFARHVALATCTDRRFCAEVGNRTAEFTGGKRRSKKGGPAEGAEPAFPPGPRLGLPPQNVAAALSALRAVAVDYFVLAEHVDLMAERFDAFADKVRGSS
jgi:hypothetical protein